MATKQRLIGTASLYFMPFSDIFIGWSFLFNFVYNWLTGLGYIIGGYDCQSVNWVAPDLESSAIEFHMGFSVSFADSDP